MVDTMVVGGELQWLEHLVADDNTLTTGSLLLSLILIIRLILGRTILGIRVSTAGTSTVKTDTIALAGDTVSFTGAAGAGAGDGAGGAGVGAARGGEGWDVGVVVGLEFGVVLLFVGFLEMGGGQAGGQGFEGRGIVLRVDDLAGLVWALGTGSSNAGGREGTALGDAGAGDAARGPGA